MKNEIKFYYSFGEVDENNKAKTMELKSFDDLNEQFEVFRKAFEEKSTNSPIINVWVDEFLDNVSRISATYDYKKGFLSKMDDFSLEAQRKLESGKISHFILVTKDIEEVKSIFYDFIVNKKAPNFNEKWFNNMFG